MDIRRDRCQDDVGHPASPDPKGSPSYFLKQAVPSGTLAKQGPGSRQHSCVNSLFPAVGVPQQEPTDPGGGCRVCTYLGLGWGPRQNSRLLALDPWSPCSGTCKHSCPLPPTPSIISPLNPPASKNTVITGVLQLSAKRSRQVTEKTQFSNWKSEGYNHIDVTGYVDGRRSFLWKWFTESLTHIHYLYDDRVSLGQHSRRGSKQWKWILGFCSGDGGARCFPGGPHKDDSLPSHVAA